MEQKKCSECSLEVCTRCLSSDVEIRYDTIPLTNGTGITFGRNEGHSYKACCVTYSGRVEVEKIKLHLYSTECEVRKQGEWFREIAGGRSQARGKMKIDDWVSFIKNGKKVLYAMEECPCIVEHTLSGWCDEKKKADKKRKK